MPVAVADFIVPPSTGGISLLKDLIVLTFAIHLPFICVMIGGSTLSIVFNLLDKDRAKAIYRRFAGELMEKMAVNRWVGILLGVLPMVTIVLLFWQILYDADIANFYRWWIAVSMLVISFALLYTYKDTFSSRDHRFGLHIGFGLGGLALLFGAYFVFFANKNFLLYPEVWTTVKKPIWRAFSSSLLPSFIYFLTFAFTITGAAILFLLVRPGCKSEEREELEYVGFIKKVALYLVLFFSLLQPVIALIELIVLPEQALSYGLFTFRALALVCGMLTCLTAYFALLRPRGSYDFFCACVTVLTLVGLFFLVAEDCISRNNSLREQFIFLNVAASEVEAKNMDMGEQGKKLYQTIGCNICHSIDGSKKNCPTFKGLFGRKEIIIIEGREQTITVDETYIRTSIKQPKAAIVKGYEKQEMPTYGLKDEKVEALIAYLKTLGK